MTLPITLALMLTSSQITVPRIEKLPNLPAPYALRDWAAVATDFDRLVFDEHIEGRYLPLVWRVPNMPNLKEPGFGMPSYVGAEKMRGKDGESLTCLGAVLGTSIVGIDKSEWVPLSEQYYQPEEGLVLNNPNGHSGGSFWYEVLPSILFTQISTKYPKWLRGREDSKAVAESWIKGIDALNGNWDHTALDFRTMKPIDNGKWKEPEAVAGVAYLELLEHLRSGDDRYLAACRKALEAMQKRQTNPTYEVLVPYGALAAAYLNAETGDKWDVARFVDWCLEPTSTYREGWGMIVGKWGDYDVGGLIGSTTDSDGYAFAMNTYLAVGTLAPIARYDARYSRAIAKWALNVANASRLYYRNALPPKNQSSYDWSEDRKACISYEGMRHRWKGVEPYATGDSKQTGWSGTDYGLYGAGAVGFLGALVLPTNVERILRVSLRNTDFLPTRAYYTELVWNPYPKAQNVEIDFGPSPVRLYDAVQSRFLSEEPITGKFTVALAPDQVVQLVHVPPKGKVDHAGRKALVDGVVIDYDASI